MHSFGSWISLDQLSSSYFVILLVILLFAGAGLLFRVGLIDWAFTVISQLVRSAIWLGFQLWRPLFAWAPWPLFLAIVSGWLIVGWGMVRILPVLTIVCALIPLFMGVTACMAYMMIDLERFAVARGHQSVHNPLEGQELAGNLVRYGQAEGVPFLISATVGMVGGFALLNFGLFNTIGRDWYVVMDGQAQPTYVDFVANALIVLLKIVDVLDFVKASHFLDVSYVRQVAWPSSTLLALFRMFFTLVLLQQVFAAIRQRQVLTETITDLWNPHEPIHERARHALPQHGPGAVGPLLISLGKVTSLTKEQRERIPLMLSAIGPAAIPSLVRHIHDSPAHVRAIVAASLGHLRVRGTIPLLVLLSHDSSDLVRQSLIDALGIIASPHPLIAGKAPRVRSRRRRGWSVLKWKQTLIPLSSLEAIDLAVKTLLAALSDDSLSVRGRAARALGQIGSSAVAAAPGLIALLKDEDETVRREAIEAVGKVGGPPASIVNALVELLEDPSPVLRQAAARQLGLMNEASVAALPALFPLLQDREISVRNAVAETIGRIGHISREAAAKLVAGFASTDSVVRGQTAEALGMIGACAAATAPALIDALADPNDTVRAKAALALGKIGKDVANVAVPGLIRALRDQDDIVSSLAAEALGQMGESAYRAIPPLIRSLQHINADVRAGAARALGKLGVDAPGAPGALERASRDDHADVRTQAIGALSMIDRPTTSIRQAVLAGLEDTDAEVRAASVEALCQWGPLDDPSLTMLLTLLQDANENVRVQVTQVLPQLAGATEAVIDGLCGRLKNDTDLVQAHAAQALGELGPAAAAAADALLLASQTGEVSVRQRAIQALELIRPATNVAEIDERAVDPNVIVVLSELEAQTNSADGVVDIVPVIVVRSTGPDRATP